MANYCTAQEVQIFVGSAILFSDTVPITKPTLTQVNQIILDTTNTIDLYLSTIGISSQPTNLLILSRLKEICLYRVAGIVLIQSNAGTTPNPDMSRTNFYLSQYEKLLKEISDNPELYGIVSGSDDYCNVSSNVLDGSRTEAEIESNFIDRNFKP